MEDSYHSMDANSVVSALKSDIHNGLSKAEVALRQERDGKNIITPKNGKSPIVMFLLQFHQPLIYI